MTKLNLEWWKNLPKAWKDTFSKETKKSDPTEILEVLKELEKFVATIMPSKKDSLLDELISEDSYVYQSESFRTDLKPIAYLSKLRTLSIFNVLINPDLTPIAKLKELRSLVLYVDTGNIEPLSKIENLKNMAITVAEVDLSPLKEIKNLQYLVLYYNKITNLEPLGQLTNLKKLEIIGYNNDLTFLSKLTNLEYLEITSDAQDLSPIANLTQLKELHLFGDESNFDLSPLSQLANLKVSVN